MQRKVLGLRGILGAFGLVGLSLLTLFGQTACLRQQDANISHSGKAIRYANEATKILNKGSAYEIIDPKVMDSVIDLEKKAIAEARLVDISALNRIYPGWGDHFEKEFMKGLTLFVEGYETIDNRKSLEGQVLLDAWGRWYNRNIEGIRKAGGN